jgi:hypothetical protein
VKILIVFVSNEIYYMLRTSKADSFQNEDIKVMKYVRKEQIRR